MCSLHAFFCMSHESCSLFSKTWQQKKKKYIFVSVKICGHVNWKNKGSIQHTGNDASVLSAHTNPMNSGGDVPGWLLSLVDNIDLFTNSFEWANTFLTLLASSLSGCCSWTSSRMSVLPARLLFIVFFLWHVLKYQLNLFVGPFEIIHFCLFIYLFIYYYYFFYH